MKTTYLDRFAESKGLALTQSTSSTRGTPPDDDRPIGSATSHTENQTQQLTLVDPRDQTTTGPKTPIILKPPLKAAPEDGAMNETLLTEKDSTRPHKSEEN